MITQSGGPTRRQLVQKPLFANSKLNVTNLTQITVALAPYAWYTKLLVESGEARNDKIIMKASLLSLPCPGIPRQFHIAGP